MVIQSNSHGTIHVCASELFGLQIKVAASQLLVKSDLWPLLLPVLFWKSFGRIVSGQSQKKYLTV